MITIVFSCVWIDAFLHLLFVKMNGRKPSDREDRKTYESKLRDLECSDEALLERVKRLRGVRKALVHEKAYSDFDDDGNFIGRNYMTQHEAENAWQVVNGINKWCREQHGIEIL